MFNKCPFCFSYPASAIRGNSSISELRLQGCRIDEAGTEQILQALTVPTNLRILDMSWNSISPEGARLLGKHIITVLSPSY